MKKLNSDKCIKLEKKKEQSFNRLLISALIDKSNPVSTAIYRTKEKKKREGKKKKTRRRRSPRRGRLEVEFDWTETWIREAWQFPWSPWSAATRSPAPSTASRRWRQRPRSEKEKPGKPFGSSGSPNPTIWVRIRTTMKKEVRIAWGFCYGAPGCGRRSGPWRC